MVQPLTKYVESCEKPQRIACYQLGLCHFNNENYDKAISLFALCNDGNDAVAQGSLLHTGIIMLEKDNINAARMAFEQASTMTFDDDVREEAMYNYALCLHQTPSPLAWRPDFPGAPREAH